MHGWDNKEDVATAQHHTETGAHPCETRAPKLRVMLRAGYAGGNSLGLRVLT